MSSSPLRWSPPPPNQPARYGRRRRHHESSFRLEVVKPEHLKKPSNVAVRKAGEALIG
jgi:hypothetical protein